MTLVLRYAARSDRGLVRANNQDSVYAGPRLLAVADGMGGHAAGEVASKVVIASLAHVDDDEPGDDLLGKLRDAVASGNGAISELVTSDPDLEGMGTTLTAILFAGNRLGLVHIGDSRAYLLREGSFAQITHDDTFVQSLIDEGRITPDEAATHPQRSLLLRALTGHDFEPSLTVREARVGDRFLLCSDGLSGVVSLETLDEAIRIPDPQACADRMIELALKGGGPDNVTVIVADVEDVDFGDDYPILGGAAGDGSEEHNTPPDSAASRASALTQQRPPMPQRMDAPPPPPQDPKRKKRNAIKAFAIIFVLLLLTGVVAVGGKLWLNTQFYVGATETGQVAIFRGLNGSVLGFKLSSKVEDSCPPGSTGCTPITLNDLQEAGRKTITAGIRSDNGLDGARAAVRLLRTEHMLPLCKDTSSTSTTPSTTPSTPSSTPNTPPVNGSPNPETGSTEPSLTPSQQKPGVECREGP
ncbi:PP2C family protein-serine/threonine phosphatase [Lentzea flaviverrucosa]|uniref:Serine/threonine protein phosphatase PstP n=1 Tax=Lentzea flaviverrucosa TaxID=200379 RepID=A0A1H9XUN4_9PSEU|nr:PP2C family serine/threonine-protein phosphatase [Lentzea flaviverrucosa]RDI18814.1 protein phosphatase [Lentzea flaviverrucosa]SES49821.1 protein phosphatase [Lentzea flaviverrucosa]